MATATMDAGATAARVDSAAIGNTTAAICDLIQEHRYHGTMSGRQAAAISAMIDDLAATAAEGRPRTTGRRRKRRMGSSRWYQDLAKLGRGSYGVVFKARHRATGQSVAVKYARPGSGSDVHDLLREACFMAACQGHPSLVGFRGVARAPGTAGEYSLVMDYVGPSLSVVLWDRRLRPFPEADVRRVMRQLLSGAEAMHERGVVHRDIKPANILVGDGGGGGVKICDFGSAKSMDEEWPTYIAGTIPYMAPEVLLYNDEHGAPVDAWSLGCVMAELLKGDLLFAGEDEADQLHKIFDVLGVPGKKAWQALKPQIFADEVHRWRARQRRVAQRSRLRELVPEELLSKEGFEVLKGLLTCDPKKRLTAAAALRCPWFANNVDDGDARAPATTAVSTVSGAATKKWSLVSVLPALALKMAMSFLRRPLGLLRPNALLN
ncbi:hypothetical protein ACP70R_018862 [Stipagrostis hirtigluma subsp. patula]